MGNEKGDVEKNTMCYLHVIAFGNMELFTDMLVVDTQWRFYFILLGTGIV